MRNLSGGERNRVHLARVLKQGANLLVLDEPTNDLDVDTLRSLEEALASFTGCALIVSHDRYFLDRLATHLLVFHGPGAAPAGGSGEGGGGGAGRVEWFEGNWSDYVEDAARRGGAAQAIVAAATAGASKKAPPAIRG